MIWRVALVILGVALCAWRFGSATLSAETIRAEGEPIFFDLAPVDPRALMLGDYMTLNYDTAALPVLDQDGPTKGVAVVSLTGDKTSFVRLHKGEALADDERLIRFRRGRWGRATYGGEAYYFQSGTGERFENAEYGVFHVMPDGRALLAGLADENRQMIAIAGQTPQ